MIKIRLSQLMREKKYSVKNVAKITGMSSTTVSHLCNEKTTRIDINNLEKLCTLFECNIQDILEYSEDEVLESL